MGRPRAAEGPSQPAARTRRTLPPGRGRSFSQHVRAEATGNRTRCVPGAVAARARSSHPAPPRARPATRAPPGARAAAEEGPGGPLSTARRRPVLCRGSAPPCPLLLPDGFGDGGHSELRGQHGQPGPRRPPAGLQAARWPPCPAGDACRGLRSASALCTPAAGYTLETLNVCHGVSNLGP